MYKPSAVDIQADEPFPHLKTAPILEAMIELRAVSHEAWEEDSLRNALSAKLTDYGYLDSQREPGNGLIINHAMTRTFREHVFTGLRFKSLDSERLAHFSRAGFTFSWLPPYLTWDAFESEALRLWSIHNEYAKVTALERMGVRFINAISLESGTNGIAELLRDPPHAPNGLNLSVSGFLHQNVFDVPGHPYAVTIVSTVQPRSADGVHGPALILDIQAYTTSVSKAARDEIRSTLRDLHWLKNKAFFGHITEAAIARFKGEGA